MTMTTVTDSKNSIMSAGSETSQTQTRRTKSGPPPLEESAKEMKYINIVFSDDDGQPMFPRLIDQMLT
jgi:hypothetical protein